MCLAADRNITLRRAAHLAVGAVVFPTVIGWCALVCRGRHPVRLLLGYRHREEARRAVGVSGQACASVRKVARAVQRYLCGRSTTIPRLAVMPSGTLFQRRVWSVVQGIPCGTAWTYGEVAEALGNRRLARAVGQALARNPLPLFIPCHRVVASRGNQSGGWGLGGFSARGGSGLKARLLRLEGCVIVPGRSSLRFRRGRWPSGARRCGFS